MCKLCYVSDLFEKLNESNVFIKWEHTNIFVLKNKILAFIIKLDMWLQKVENDSLEMFSYTQDFIVEKKFKGTQSSVKLYFYYRSNGKMC